MVQTMEEQVSLGKDREGEDGEGGGGRKNERREGGKESEKLEEGSEAHGVDSILLIHNL